MYDGPDTLKTCTKLMSAYQRPSPHRFVAATKARSNPAKPQNAGAGAGAGAFSQAVRPRGHIIEDEPHHPSASRFSRTAKSDDRTPTRKRQFVDAFHELGDSTSDSVLSSVATPTSSRFRLPRPSSTGTGIAVPEQRPAFLSSQTATTHITEPVPETFSPQKRGQRYLPGGLAASMQMHVFGAADMAMRANHESMSAQTDARTCNIEHVTSGGNRAFYARGTALNGIPLNVLMVSATQHGHVPNAGDCVRLRAPTWTVNVLDQEWTMGIDWKCV